MTMLAFGCLGMQWARLGLGVTGHNSNRWHIHTCIIMCAKTHSNRPHKWKLYTDTNLPHQGWAFWVSVLEEEDSRKRTTTHTRGREGRREGKEECNKTDKQTDTQVTGERKRINHNRIINQLGITTYTWKLHSGILNYVNCSMIEIETGNYQHLHTNINCTEGLHSKDYILRF